MRPVGTSEDAYVTQNWRALRFGRCFVTLIRDELTATASLRGPTLLTDQPRRSLGVRHSVTHPRAIDIQSLARHLVHNAAEPLRGICLIPPIPSPIQDTYRTHSPSASAPVSDTPAQTAPESTPGSKGSSRDVATFKRLSEYRKFMPRGASACVEVVRE
jgi:hypothetical protein